ncbi:NADH-quinone oxidoreductase subunit J [Kineococcus sp. SYSU DK004]|uniref:NADH-quinone oxidoreductase subunit J n=1 Tax=Kineococcus sp. SYSU DK004 TaxID=3383125 RepID=UPI003D7F0653
MLVDADPLTGAVFWVLGAVAVAAGVAVFRTSSMARATYALAVSFVAVGAALLLLRSDYLGVVTVLMMVMEMAVMGVYMVMFMGMNPALMPMSMVHGRRTALAVSTGAFVVLAGGALLVPWPGRAGPVPADATVALGEATMGSHMLVMLAVSAVLFATIVSGVVLTHPRSRYDRFGDDLRGPARDPQPGGVGRGEHR